MDFTNFYFRSMQNGGKTIVKENMLYKQHRQMDWIVLVLQNFVFEIHTMLALDKPIVIVKQPESPIHHSISIHY